eukprot:2495455-Amphidinium_carterae.1
MKKFVADKSGGNLRRNVDGKPALDALIDPKFIALAESISSKEGDALLLSAQRDPYPAKRSMPPPQQMSQRPAKLPKGGGKGGKSKSDRGNPSPPQLRGIMSHIADGKRIRFSYHLAGCQHSASDVPSVVSSNTMCTNIVIEDEGSLSQSSLYIL